MKQFLVNIWAYDCHAKFNVLAEDNPASLEQAILDKLGEKVIVWENLGNSYSDKINSCLLYTSPSPRDLSTSRMPSSA